MHFVLNLLGSLDAYRNEIPISFSTEKSQVLLAYLACHPGKPLSRSFLSGLLWPEYTEESARNSLRTELNRLRQAIDTADESVLQTTRQDLQFDASKANVDLLQFFGLLATCQSHAHAQIQQCAHCARLLAEATDLYRGDFLADFDGNDSPAVDDWIRSTQHTVRQQMFWALETLIAQAALAGNQAGVIAAAQRQLELSATHEPAYRHLMRGLTLDGQRGAALQLYARCLHLLRDDLGVEPEPETIALYEQIQVGISPAQRPDAPTPYQGLHAFESHDADHFFGREQMTERLVDAIHRHRLIALIGPSGSGKSSLVQAGVLVRLARYTWRTSAPTSDLLTVDDASGPGAQRRLLSSPADLVWPLDAPMIQWHLLQFRPGEAPPHTLGDCVERWLATVNSPDMAHAVAENPLVRAAQILPLGTGEEKLLVFVDQFEEMFTLCSVPALRQSFIDLLVEAMQATNVVVLLAMRADFMAQALSHRPLADALQEASFVLGPMGRDEIRNAIEKPARLQGVIFEPGLVDRLLDDVGEAPGNLPLLQFALTLLWQEQNRGWLTHEAYEEIERVGGALTHYANGFYARLHLQQQVQLRRIFLQLVQPGQATEATRRTATRPEIGEEDWPLVHQLASARLVVTNRNAQGQETVELIHEALIREWQQLRRWLEEDREFRVWQERLRTACEQWAHAHHDEGALLRGGLLAEAERWREERGADLALGLLAYIEASVDQRAQVAAAEEAQHQRELAHIQTVAQMERQRADAEISARRRTTRFAWAAVLAFVVALLVAVYAFQLRAIAETERIRAEENAERVLARQLSSQALRATQGEIDQALLLSVEVLHHNAPAAEKADFLAEFPINPLLYQTRYGPPLPIYSMVFCPDGRHIFTTDDKGSVLVWSLDKPTAAPLVLLAPDAKIKDVVFSPLGDRMAINFGGRVEVWGMEPPQKRFAIYARASAITRLAFAQDGSALAVGDQQKMLMMYDAETGTALWEPFPFDGKQPINADGNIVRQIDESNGTLHVSFRRLSTGEQIIDPTAAGHTGDIHSSAFSPDSTLMASASFDGSVVLWDVKTGARLEPPLLGHDGRALLTLFSPDGKILITAGADETVWAWDLGKREALGMPLLGHNNWVRAAAFSRDGEWLATADADGKILLWHWAARHILRGHTDRVRSLALSPDERTLVVASMDRTLSLWDAATLSRTRVISTTHPRSIMAAVYSPDGATLATVDAGFSLLLWDTSTWTPRAPLQILHTDVLVGIAFSPDSNIVVTGGFDGKIGLWDVKSGRPIQRPIRRHTDWVLSLAISPDGKTLVSGSKDTTIKVWDFPAMTERMVLTGHTNWVTDLLFTPDGKTLVSASSDQSIRTWDLESGKESAPPLLGHEAQVWDLAWSQEETGSSLVSLGADGDIYWWDWAMRLPLRPPLHTGTESEVMVLNAAGDRLYLGSFRPSAEVWEIATQPWIEVACRIANRNFGAAEWQSFMHEQPYGKTCPQFP